MALQTIATATGLTGAASAAALIDAPDRNTGDF